MAKKKPVKKAKKPGTPCHMFNYKNKKQYIIERGEKRLINKGDPEYREWPDISIYMDGVN